MQASNSSITPADTIHLNLNSPISGYEPITRERAFTGWYGMILRVRAFESWYPIGEERWAMRAPRGCGPELVDQY